MGEVLLRIAGDVHITDTEEENPKKKKVAHRKGSANIYIISVGESKVVAKKKEKLAKLCPS